MEVLQAALGLRTPLALGGHFLGAHGVGFGPGLGHVFGFVTRCPRTTLLIVRGAESIHRFDRRMPSGGILNPADAKAKFLMR
jgi:hypothetical protein